MSFCNLASKMNARNELRLAGDLYWSKTNGVTGGKVIPPRTAPLEVLLIVLVNDC